MTAQEYIDACNECRDAQRAAELLRIGIQLAEDDIRVRNIAERMKETIERERVTIKQYAEQVERLKTEIEDLTAELEDKRIQLAELGSLRKHRPSRPLPISSKTSQQPPKNNCPKKRTAKNLKARQTALMSFGQLTLKRLTKQNHARYGKNLRPMRHSKNR